MRVRSLLWHNLVEGREFSASWVSTMSRVVKRSASQAVKSGPSRRGDHDTGDGELILKHAVKLGFEGVVSKTIDAPYAPGNRGLWRKAKARNRQEFVVVGWSDPEGSRPHLGALLLGYYTDDGKLTYAGRVGTGMPVKVLADLRRRLDPLARKTSPLRVPPPRGPRFGSPLVLSRVHWVEPRLVAEITYLTWTTDNLLRHTVYVGLREDKPADQVRLES
jgi:ATP-dependent DNA ligase